MLCGVVSGLLGWFGLLLCLIGHLPDGLLAPRTALILDRNLEFWPAMEIARKVVTRSFWPAFGLAVVALLLWIAGILCCGIGIFVTGPIATGAAVEAYRRLFETQPSGGTPA